MTTREFLTAIATSEDIANFAPELAEEASARIAKLDAANAARKAKASSKPSKTALENEPIKAASLAHLADMTEPLSAAELGEALDITTAKAASLCGKMVKEGVLERTEVKVPKKGKTNKYSVAQQSANGETSCRGVSPFLVGKQ